eukprot:CAMPEP_0201917712 /NCGR_PEP_ID=MMETSP0903-20130614/7019_1 /ASSEMBLY_ACC=CAM_ASM_000552 /TAXON_ID=420261 /ORGANISM="Thalassiosira antarctica, Strain CCMP982" /LENGTH=30 /DNA_ID= /DNA_START= /DNA_END= /DNA_ORIENTATION=
MSVPVAGVVAKWESKKFEGDSLGGSDGVYY